MRGLMINTLFPTSYGITYRNMPKSIRQKGMDLDTDCVKKEMSQEHFQQDITKMGQKYLLSRKRKIQGALHQENALD